MKSKLVLGSFTAVLAVAFAASGATPTTDGGPDEAQQRPSPPALPTSPKPSPRPIPAPKKPPPKPAPKPKPKG